MGSFFIHSLKNSKKLMSLLTIAVVLVGFILPVPAFAETIVLKDLDDSATNPASTSSVGSHSSDVIRVGLYYADDALPTANLQNAVGSGFEFGYYNDSYSFVSQAWTDETAITMAKDKNLYLNGSVYSESGTGSLLGAYHVQLSECYISYDDAKNEAEEYDSAFPAFVDGEFYVRIGSFESAAEAENLAEEYHGSTVVGMSATCITVCKITTNTIIFEYDPGDTSGFAIMPRASGGQKAVTWFKGYKYYGGFQYTRAQGNDVTVMNFVDIDDYAAGVIAYEMSASWPVEALKAQAVCARSYAVSCNNHQTFDVCPTTSCQVYRGVYSGTNEARIAQAIQETAGQCAYYEGKVISTVYHSSDGGATESAENTWGGTDRPYLVGKIDTYEKQTENSNSSWTYYYTLADFSDILKNSGYPNSGISDVEITKFSSTGNVNELTFTTTDGKEIKITGDSTRGIFEDYKNGRFFSRRYTITAPGEAVSSEGTLSVYVNGGTAISGESFHVLTGSGTSETSGQLSVISGAGTVTQVSSEAIGGGTVLSSDKYTIVGGGWGHNVGMSQYGAKAMAELGHTYDEIIKFYFTGVSIY